MACGAAAVKPAASMRCSVATSSVRLAWAGDAELRWAYPGLARRCGGDLLPAAAGR
jgi:hypothetical protein